MRMCQIAKVSSKFCQILYQNGQSFLKVMLNWQNFAKSGHTESPCFFFFCFSLTIHTFLSLSHFLTLTHQHSLSLSLSLSHFLCRLMPEKFSLLRREASECGCRWRQGGHGRRSGWLIDAARLDSFDGVTTFDAPFDETSSASASARRRSWRRCVSCNETM